MRKFLGITLVLLAGTLQADSNSGQGDTVQETITQLEALWGENQCETITVRKKGYPLISIACTGNFDRARRAKFLDVLFKNDFQLKKETYRLRPQNGMYLYKTQQGRKNIYFKLYVRGALDLWPRNPVQGKQLAIYVQNVRAATDLVRWRTLGIPVTFGVTLGRGDSDVILAVNLAQPPTEAMRAEHQRESDGQLYSARNFLPIGGNQQRNARGDQQRADK